uniref:Unkown protein n=1 Tax=Riptortus pedestris TaxID=329032 RepID=R4WK21_RIPPE|nr:unkown protein [Riptortus pedestris]
MAPQDPKIWEKNGDQLPGEEGPLGGSTNKEFGGQLEQVGRNHPGGWVGWKNTTIFRGVPPRRSIWTNPLRLGG